MADNAAEIAKIEHEIDILRARYALFERGAEWLRRTLVAAGIILAGLILWRIILGDFFGAVLVVIICVSTWLGVLRYRKKRLIDLVSATRFPQFFGPSEAREIQTMIAMREKRLAEIKEQVP
jgi:hypothetical protein